MVLIPESNLGFEANHVTAAVQRAKVENWVVLTESGTDGVGFRTTHATKEAGSTAVEELLAANALNLADNLVSLAMPVDEVVKMLIAQLDGFQVIIEPAKTPFGVAKRAYSGKVGGNQDDLCMSLQLLVLGARCFLRKDKYSRFRDE